LIAAVDCGHASPSGALPRPRGESAALTFEGDGFMSTDFGIGSGESGADARARQVESSMSDEERFGLVISVIGALAGARGGRRRAESRRASDERWYTPGVPRLGAPSLLMTDASMGIANPGFPILVLLIALVFVLGPGIATIIVAVTVVDWLVYARLARTSARRERAMEYVLAR
jgi:hypothetical protein